MKQLSIVLVGIFLLIMNNCGGDKSSEETSSSSSSSTQNSETLTHNGTNYGTVVSPYTGKVWLDRNLGAARVCTSFNDTACYGDYYQWGRNFDGHQESTSSTTTQQVADINSAGNEFVLDSGQHRGDWANDSDRSGDKRMALISSSDGSFVCPKDFRVPSVGEFLAETAQASAQVKNNMDAYNNFLKLPSSGSRMGSTGNMRIDDTSAFYMVRGGNYDRSTDYFYYSSDDIGKGGLSARVNGQTIRCIKK